MKLFERFDKVYCINLDKRPDRLENFDKQVKKYNLGEYVRVSAFDGSNLNYDTKTTNGVSNGAFGLLTTNIKIINEAISENLNSILIIEDDCYFTDEIIDIDTYFDCLPNDWDMLYMGGNHLVQPTIINEKIGKVYSTYTTHFVGIKSTIFQDILKNIEPKHQPIDVIYSNIHNKYNTYTFIPAIAKQQKGFSDIEKTIVDYDPHIK
jgi:GR25 family glycosyltransferase involved in LPS biosynthesis